MSTVKAVIFDMDGVIIDSEPIHLRADKMMIEAFGYTITDNEMNNYVGISNPEMWADLKVRFGISASIYELIQQQTKHKSMIFENTSLQPIEGITELLKELKKSRLKIGLASSSPKDFIELMLNNLKLIDYFEVIVSGEEVEKSKPAPDIFLKACELLNVLPSECIVIEDSKNGVAAAKAAGIKCIGYINPNSGNQDLSLSNIQVKSIKEINCKDWPKNVSKAIFTDSIL